MRLTDDDIRMLEGLVDVTRPPDSPSALKRLAAELANRYIPADELTIDTGQAERPLDGHILLGTASAVYTHRDKLWPGLNGGGIHTGCVFGDLSNQAAFHRAVAAFRDPGCVRGMRILDTPQAPIADRVVFCIRVLGQSAMASAQPEVFQSVQRHLSELLLAFPVLMHPRVLVPVDRGGKLEYMSVLHALATGSGGLPRLSHLVGPSSGLKAPLAERDALERLRAFARHPCVRLAMHAQTCMHVAVGAGKPGAPRAIVMRPTGLMKFAFAIPSPRVQFLASVMEMQTINGDPVALPLLGPALEAASKDPADALRRSVLLTLAMSLYAASGMVHTPANGASPTAAGGDVRHPPGVVSSDDRLPEFDPDRATCWRRHPSDHAMLAALKTRAAILLREPEYEHAVRQVMSKRIFLGRFDDLSVSDVQTNTEAAISGLVASGFEQSRSDAGACAVLAVLGPDRPGGGLPKAEVQAASAFLEAIDGTGALGATGAPQLQNVLDAVRHYPDYAVPFRENWVLALTIFENSRTVKTALEASRGRLAREEQGEMQAVEPAAERRRARLSV